jgi:hypothetical protein
MQKFLLAAAVLLLAQAARAQGFTTATYWLTGEPQKAYTGRIRTNKNGLQVKDAQGQITTIAPERVAYIRYSKTRAFMAVSSSFLNSEYTTPVLAEVADSGRVMLLYYAQNMGQHSVLGGNSIYLLIRPGDAQPQVLPQGVYFGGGKNFREVLAPYIAPRADLAKMLDDKRIDMNNVQRFIHAFNVGEPFIIPPVTY